MRRNRKQARLAEGLSRLDDDQLDRIAADVLFMIGENARRGERAATADTVCPASSRRWKGCPRARRLPKS